MDRSFVVEVFDWSSFDALREEMDATLFFWKEARTAWFMVSDVVFTIYTCYVNDEVYENMLVLGEHINARPVNVSLAAPSSPDQGPR